MLWLLVFLAVLPYVNALWASFVFDDRLLIQEHPVVVQPSSLGEILTAKYWGTIEEARLWRPLTTLSFVVDRRIAGEAAWWPHWVNLCLHAGVTVLLFLLIVRLFANPMLALVAAGLFAVHPLHTEAVTWASGRAELLAAGFGFLALHAGMMGRERLPLSPARGKRFPTEAAGGEPAEQRGKRFPPESPAGESPDSSGAAGSPRGKRFPSWLPLVLTPSCVFLAVSAKESAAIVPFILLYSSWALRKRGNAPPVSLGLVALVPVVAYVLLRHQVLGTWSGPQTDPVDNPLVKTSLFGRIPTVLDLTGRFVLLLLWPARLSADYSAPVLGVVRSVTSQLLLGGVAAVTLVTLAVRRPATPHGWGSGFAILAYALASNLFVVIGTIFAERLLYLPSAGLLLVIASAGMYFYARSGPVAARSLQVAFLVVVLACCVRAWDRNRDYRSLASFYEEGARTQPRSPKMRLNYSVALRDQGRYEEALVEAAEAMRLDPGGQDQRDVYATALDKLGRTGEAKVFLSKIVGLDHLDRKARRRLIDILDREGDEARGDSLLAAGLREDPEHPDWMVLTARRAQAKGDYASATRMWRRAIERTETSKDPDDQAVAANAPVFLGFCYLRMGRADSALVAYEDALRRSPESAAAANGLAWSMLETGRDAREAQRHAREAVMRDPIASYYDTLARASLAAEDCESALQAARRAVELDSTSASYRGRLEEVQARCGTSGM